MMFQFNASYSGIFLIILQIFSIVFASSKNDGEIEQIKFVLRHGNKQRVLNMEDASRMEELSKFKGIKVYTHGFADNCNSCLSNNITEAYMKHAKDQAVICVDWFPLSVTYAKVKGVKGRFRDYDQVLKNVPIVGERIAEFFTFLLKKKVLKNLDNVHLIGTSLGAHVVGVAGNRLNGQVGRITGLDPAGKGFGRSTPLSERLEQSDAKYVDVIHSNAGRVGTNLAIGHADFFPNGGRSQPNCARVTDIHCDHVMAAEYFTRSIENPKYATACKCESWERYLENKCVCSPVPFGEYSNPGTSGKYYLNILDVKGDICERLKIRYITLQAFPSF